MPANPFAACLAVTLHEEGGFSNDPQDPGGITNLGVTMDTWEGWVGHSVSVGDMHALTPALVTPLYQARFWQALSCDRMPVALALCVFDFGVNSGDSCAARYLQSQVGAVADGHIGPATLAALQQRVAATSLAGQIKSYQAARLAHFKSLPEWPHDGNGWSGRVTRVQTAALAMIA